MQVLTRRRFCQVVGSLAAEPVLASGKFPGCEAATESSITVLQLLVEASIVSFAERRIFEHAARRSAAGLSWVTLDDPMRLGDTFAHLDGVRQQAAVHGMAVAVIARPAMAFALRTHIEPQWRVLLSAHIRASDGASLHRFVGTREAVNELRDGAAKWKGVIGFASGLLGVVALSQGASGNTEKIEADTHSRDWQASDLDAWLAASPRSV
ncbi:MULTISPECIES: hypothetical protein [Burkholderiaceae]|uniref:hypothetical protein n=1 Tax=Burkholderiaceae TaxID=119060 RepID=UPI0012FD033B|nr:MULTISPECIES: hypothetical protein [Burkholderiaceae]